MPKALHGVTVPLRKSESRSERAFRQFQNAKTIAMYRRALSALATLAVAGVSLPAHAQTPERPGSWRDCLDWDWVFTFIIIIIFVSGIIIAIALDARWLGRLGKIKPRMTPLQILEERFASGEIDKEDFEERKRLLSNCM